MPRMRTIWIRYFLNWLSQAPFTLLINTTTLHVDGNFITEDKLKVYIQSLNYHNLFNHHKLSSGILSKQELENISYGWWSNLEL